MEYKLMGAQTLQDKVFKDKVAEDKAGDKPVNNMVLQAKLVKGRVFKDKVVKDKVFKGFMELLAVSIVEEEDILWAKLMDSEERKYYHHQSCLRFAIFSIAWQIFEILLK